MFVSLTACSSNKLKGTYKLEESGVFGTIVSASGLMDSLTFKGDKVTVSSSSGTLFVGKYTLDDSIITIIPIQGG